MGHTFIHALTKTMNVLGSTNTSKPIKLCNKQWFGIERGETLIKNFALRTSVLFLAFFTSISVSLIEFFQYVVAIFLLFPSALALVKWFFLPVVLHFLSLIKYLLIGWCYYTRKSSVCTCYQSSASSFLTVPVMGILWMLKNMSIAIALTNDSSCSC